MCAVLVFFSLSVLCWVKEKLFLYLKYQISCWCFLSFFPLSQFSFSFFLLLSKRQPYLKLLRGTLANKAHCGLWLSGEKGKWARNNCTCTYSSFSLIIRSCHWLVCFFFNAHLALKLCCAHLSNIFLSFSESARFANSLFRCSMP